MHHRHRYLGVSVCASLLSSALCLQSRFLSDLRAFQTSWHQTLLPSTSDVVPADSPPTTTAVKVVTAVEALRTACKQFMAASSPSPELGQAIEDLLQAADVQVGKKSAGAAESCKLLVVKQCQAAINAEALEEEMVSVSTCSALEALASASQVSTEKKEEYLTVAKCARLVLDLVNYSVRVAAIPKTISEKSKDAVMQHCLMDFKKFKDLSGTAEAEGSEQLSKVLFGNMPDERKKLCQTLGGISECVTALES